MTIFAVFVFVMTSLTVREATVRAGTHIIRSRGALAFYIAREHSQLYITSAHSTSTRKHATLYITWEHSTLFITWKHSHYI